MRDVLDEYEIRRADRFLFDKHRHRFVVGRARVRQLLAGYRLLSGSQFSTDDGKENDAAIEFGYSNLGKPHLAGLVGHGDLYFNFSNSLDLGLLAVTRECELGVDLEQIREMSDLTGLASRYFARSESAAIFACSESTARMQAFFRFWTRKEAYLKAVGKGLTFPLRDVEVSLGDGTDTRIVTINSGEDDAQNWSLEHLDPGSGYVGAVAICFPSPRIPDAAVKGTCQLNVSKHRVTERTVRITLRPLRPLCLRVSSPLVGPMIS